MYFLKLMMTLLPRCVLLCLLSRVVGGGADAQTQSIAVPWSGHGHDAQHTALSQVASKPLQQILWQTPVDLAPQYSGGKLYAHYGSALVTRQNTVIIPVKTGASDGFRIEARNASDGSLKWMQTTDYSLPTHSWVPHYCIALTPKNRVYYAGAGGTVYYRDAPDTASPPPGSTGQLAFYDLANYTADTATFDSNVKINTAITSDRYGNIYFGFLVSGSVTLPGGSPLVSGIARIAEDGTGSWVSAQTASDDLSMTKLPHNQAPALSNDHRTLYMAVSSDSLPGGYLVALDSRTLATINKVRLKDVLNPSAYARLMNDGTASPMVGPDDDVYFGVFENSYGANHYRGWLLHFEKNLIPPATPNAPGAFGWDHTASVVPASLVSSYSGASEYLLLSKYNHYALLGDGVNKMAVLDPNDTMTDPVTGIPVMKEVLTIAGPTPDSDYPGYPNAVREWCVNTVVVDPFTHSVIVPNEDGKVYRWDLHTNTLSETVTLPLALGQAYTPTVIGVDGTIYVVSDAKLFAIGGATP